MKSLLKCYNHITMPIIIIPTSLRYYTKGNTDIPVKGKNVAEALNNLCENYPSVEKNLFNREGLLDASVQIVVNKDFIDNLDGLQTPLKDNDILRIIPIIAGGK